MSSSEVNRIREVMTLKLPLEAFVVLAILAAHWSTTERVSYPSVKTIAGPLLDEKKEARARMSISTVRRILRWLEQLGLITADGKKTGGRGRPTHYRLNLKSANGLTSESRSLMDRVLVFERRSHKDRVSAAKGGHATPERRSQTTLKAVTDDAKGGHMGDRRTIEQLEQEEEQGAQTSTDTPARNGQAGPSVLIENPSARRASKRERFEQIRREVLQAIRGGISPTDLDGLVKATRRSVAQVDAAVKQLRDDDNLPKAKLPPPTPQQMTEAQREAAEKNRLQMERIGLGGVFKPMPRR